jgi:diguanylate cyclase (GGDEF)-like protein/PAS domain S-box-containing protein
MSTDSRPPLDRVLDLLLDAVCAVDAEGRFVFASAACERIFGYTPEEMIGRNIIEMVHPDDRERTLKAAAQIMRDQPHPHFENRYVRKDGRVVHIMWSARWSASDGIRLAVARDVTALKHAETIQSALYRISEAAHAAEGLSALCRHIHRIVGELLPADSFLVALYDESSGTLSFPYIADEREHGREPQRLDSGTPIAEVIHTGQCVLAKSGDGAAGTAAVPAPGGRDADWLGVPLTSRNGVMGALVVQSHGRNMPYTPEHKDLLQYVSTQIATAIERKQTQIRLHHMALHDPLTDLPNRALFHDRFDVALKRAGRNGEHLALLYVDLDEFKQVNDTFGHEAGDLVLRDVARRLVQCVRESDTVGRMGGDEFTVLLTNIHAADSAGLVADKVRAAINAPFELAGRTLALSATIGIAVYPENGNDKAQLLRHADGSMYATKPRRG